jgi:hypothetical protein
MKTNTLTKLAFFILFAFIILAVFSGCAKREVVDACLQGHKYGFWGGLWHGIIAPIDFVAMLIDNKYTMYAQNNNGAWYAFGFLLGSGGWGFLGGKGISRKHK